MSNRSKKTVGDKTVEHGPVDPILGPEQTEGGVRPENPQLLSEEDHGSYAAEASRQNDHIDGGESLLEERKRIHDEAAAVDKANTDQVLKDTLAREEAALRAAEPFVGSGGLEPPSDEVLAEQDDKNGGKFFGADESGAPVGLLASDDESPRSYRHDYLGLDRSSDSVRSAIEALAKKNLDEKRGEGDEGTKNDAERQAMERALTRLPQPGGNLQWRNRLESRKTFQVGDAPAVFVPRIGDTVLVFLAAHCSFKRAPVPAAVDFAAVTDEQRAAASTSTVRVLEPLPAIVTHLGDDAFSVEVLGARSTSKVNETFRFNDYDHLGNRWSGWWVWPEP